MLVFPTVSLFLVFLVIVWVAFDEKIVLVDISHHQFRDHTQHGSMKRQTLRTISYADCKMGVDDRTIRSVKSTSAGGRYIKRGKERTMIVDGGTGDGGYEEFLRMRHKDEGSVECDSSGDSDRESLRPHPCI
jgi:hypothetical protein